MGVDVVEGESGGEHQHLCVIEQLAELLGGPVRALMLGRHPRLGGLLDQLVGENGAVERAIAPGGPIERISELTDVIGQLAPSIVAIQETVHELRDAVDVLNNAVTPLGDLAGRLPKRLTRNSGRTHEINGHSHHD